MFLNGSSRLSWPWRALWERLARRSVRDNEVSLIAASALISVAIGLGVIVLQLLVQQLHEIAFAIPSQQRLSTHGAADWWRVLLVPCLGGLLSGGATILIRRWRPREIVDAIEANALFGGKMSLTDSANLALLTIISSGFGASVGLEAAYTQLGSGMASKFGQILKVRRGDLRTLVGCGAAAGIAAAFNAPLAGAFYAFELVIGSYTPAVLAPISMAALSSTLVVRALYGDEAIFGLDAQVHITGTDYALFAGVGVLAAVIAIATMTGVTRIERFLRRQALPRWVGPTVGGLVVGMIATIFPQVLGSGHGALQLVLENGLPWTVLLGLIAAKGLASAVSVGAGFRGGLFSSSLLLGAVFGGAVVVALQAGLHLAGLTGIELDRVAYMLVGMGAVAAAVVGAPLTMIFLVLELTGSFPAALGVMVGVIIASLVVRQTFGYSFATWRFHVRGVPIRGGFDVGWIEDLSVGKLMRKDAPAVPLGTTVAEFRKRFPLGGPKRVFLVDPSGRYAGIVVTADAYSPDLDQKLDQPIDPLATTADQFLLPEQNVRTALRRFGSSETETLAVVSDAKTLHVVGFLTEGYALRRYNQELERARAEEIGEHSLYGPA
ncbi:MAG TPA: chloride channel protein [Stellaceae bacterium]|nr:chloride channel protein [Stellaceae bacterium]